MPRYKLWLQETVGQPPTEYVYCGHHIGDGPHGTTLEFVVTIGFNPAATDKKFRLKSIHFGDDMEANSVVEAMLMLRSRMRRALEVIDRAQLIQDNCIPVVYHTKEGDEDDGPGDN